MKRVRKSWNFTLVAECMHSNEIAVLPYIATRDGAKSSSACQAILTPLSKKTTN